jgi:hypothetical protein
MIEIEGVKYLTMLEAARHYGVSVGTVRNWRCDDCEPVPGVKIGQTVLYREADVRADVKAHGKRGRK